MCIHLILHVENDALGDVGVDVALQHEYRLRDRERDQRQQQQLNQQLHVFANQRLIDDSPGDDRRKQPDHRADEYRKKHKHKLHAIGLEIRQNTHQKRFCHLWAILFFFLSEKPAHAAKSPAHSLCHSFSSAIVAVVFCVSCLAGVSRAAQRLYPSAWWRVPRARFRDIPRGCLCRPRTLRRRPRQTESGS